jgi:hypothetical protein
VVTGLRARGGTVPPFPVIGRRAAARLARTELAKPAYHPRPSLSARLVHAVLSWLARLYSTASKLPGGWWAQVALAALVVIVAAAVLAWARPAGRARRPGQPADSPRPKSARARREAARGHAEAGDFGAAICECLRAIAAELDERGLLAPRAARTVDEFAAEAGRLLPAHAAGLRAAARLFDEIRYGQGAGTSQGYQRLRELDRAVAASAARPGRTG